MGMTTSHTRSLAKHFHNHGLPARPHAGTEVRHGSDGVTRLYDVETGKPTHEYDYDAKAWV